MKEAYVHTSFEATPDLTLVRPNGYSKSGDLFMAEAAEQLITARTHREPARIHPDVVAPQAPAHNPESYAFQQRVGYLENLVDETQDSAEREKANLELERLYDLEYGLSEKRRKLELLEKQKEDLWDKLARTFDVDGRRSIERGLETVEQWILSAEDDLYRDGETDGYEEGVDGRYRLLASTDKNHRGFANVVRVSNSTRGGATTTTAAGSIGSPPRGGGPGRRRGRGGPGGPGGPDGGNVERDPYHEPQSFEAMIVDIARYFVEGGKQTYSPIDGKFPLFKAYPIAPDGTVATEAKKYTSWKQFYEDFRPLVPVKKTDPTTGEEVETGELTIGDSRVRLDVDVSAFNRWGINAANLLKSSSPRSQHDFFSNAGIQRIPGRARGLTLSSIVNDATAETLFRSENIYDEKEDGTLERRDFASARFELMKAIIALGFENNSLAMTSPEMGTAEGAQKNAEAILYGLNNPVFNTSVLQNATEISQYFTIEGVKDAEGREKSEIKQDHRVGAAVALTVETYQMISSEVFDHGHGGHHTLKEHFRIGDEDLLTKEMFLDIRDSLVKKRGVEKSFLISDKQLETFFYSENDIRKKDRVPENQSLSPEQLKQIGQLKFEQQSAFIDFMNPYNSNAKPPLQVEFIREVVKRVVGNKVGLYYRNKEGQFISPDFDGKTKTFTKVSPDAEIYKGEWNEVKIERQGDKDVEVPDPKTAYYKRHPNGLFALVNEEGKFIDKHGKLIDKDGRFINNDGRFVKKDGTLFENGYIPPLVLDDGKPNPDVSSISNGGPEIDNEFIQYVDYVGQGHLRPLLISQKFDNSLQGFNFFTRLSLRAAMGIKNFGKNKETDATRFSNGGIRTNVALFPSLLTSVYEAVTTRAIDKTLTDLDPTGAIHYKSIAQVYKDIAAPFLVHGAKAETQKELDERTAQDKAKSEMWGKLSKELVFEENAFRGYNDNVIRPAIKLFGILGDESKVDPKKILLWDEHAKTYRIDEHHLWGVLGDIGGTLRNMLTTYNFDGTLMSLMPTDIGKDIHHLTETQKISHYIEMPAFQAMFNPLVFDVEDFTKPLRIVNKIFMEPANGMGPEVPFSEASSYVFQVKNNSNQYVRLTNDDGTHIYYKVNRHFENNVVVDRLGVLFNEKDVNPIEVEDQSPFAGTEFMKSRNERQVNHFLANADKSQVIEEGVLAMFGAWVANLVEYGGNEKILQPHQIEQLKEVLRRVMNGIHTSYEDPLHAHPTRRIFTDKQIDRWFNEAQRGTHWHLFSAILFDFRHAFNPMAIISGISKQVMAA